MSFFDKIAGYEAEKEELQTLVDIFNNRADCLAKGATLPRGIVFYGEAGTGKTLFARVLAEECALHTIEIDVAAAASAQDLCRHIRRAFIKGARSRCPTMIFFDELDKVLPNPSEEYYTDQSKAVLTQLLTLIDGMHTVDNIVFVATCNDYGDLPESLTRPGRFDKKIALGLPTCASRAAILKMYMEASSCRFALEAEAVAKLSPGFSCAALKTLVNECVLRSDTENFVSEQLIRQKITEIEGEDLACEKSELSQTVQAARNIGSFLAARAYNKGNYLLSLGEHTVCNAFLDSVLSEFDSAYDDEYDDDDDEDDEGDRSSGDTPFSKNDLLAAVTALLGGYAAEELIFHKTHHTFYRAMRIINRIVRDMQRSGMLGWTLTFDDGEWYRSQDFLSRIETSYAQIVTECYEKAKTIVSANEQLIKGLMPVLVRRGSLEKRECEPLLAKFGGVTHLDTPSRI